MRARISGFTLIELSIVLVVIALVVAGVISGSSIIRAAKINAQVAQFKKFEVAYNAFRLAYDAIPGDMVNASSYWSTATNGNGNRQIEDSGGWNASHAGTRDGEKIRFFHHLYVAGLVPEVYNGNAVVYAGLDGLHGRSVDQNVPALSLDPIYYLIAATRASNTISFGLDVVNVSAILEGIFLFAPSVENGFYPVDPPDMSALDRKMDDGFPSSGRVLAYWNNACATSTTPVTYLNTHTKGRNPYACAAQYMLSK